MFPSCMALLYPRVALYSFYICVCCVASGLLGHGSQNEMRPRKVKGQEAAAGKTKGNLSVTEKDSSRVICCRQAYGK